MKRRGVPGANPKSDLRVSFNPSGPQLIDTSITTSRTNVIDPASTIMNPAHAAPHAAPLYSSTRLNPSQPRPLKSGLPQRTTKTSQKLVLFPEDGGAQKVEPYILDYPELFSAPESVLPEAARSDAERMSKEKRAGLPRVTSYVIGESNLLPGLIRMMQQKHGVRPKLYDECVYAFYDSDAKMAACGMQKIPMMSHFIPQQSNSIGNQDENSNPLISHLSTSYNITDTASQTPSNFFPGDGEVFIFDYGVIVFWNFNEAEENQYLSALTPFIVNPYEKGQMEVEEFHFQYDLTPPHQPRIFNDLITLKSGNSMIKLTISHAIAQSVKLTLFEGWMESTIENTEYLPRMMALYGEVKMSRSEVTKIVGSLYKLRMNVNLVSNVLDTPELFWSEPELEPLYNAIRGYLEISQRVTLLNQRAEVISDLLDMLSEHTTSQKLTYQTWIIIVLIIIAICIAIAEVAVKALKFREKRGGKINMYNNII